MEHVEKDIGVDLNFVPTVFTPVINPQIHLGDSASHPSHYLQPFMVMNHLTSRRDPLKQPEGLGGNSLGQRPRKRSFPASPAR